MKKTISVLVGAAALAGMVAFAAPAQASFPSEKAGVASAEKHTDDKGHGKKNAGSKGKPSKKEPYKVKPRPSEPETFISGGRTCIENAMALTICL